MTGRYLHGDAVDQIFAEEVGGQTRWTLTDHLGSVRDVLSDTGLTLGRITYDAFGQVTNTTGIVDTLFRYTGRPGMATPISAATSLAAARANVLAETAFGATFLGTMDRPRGYTPPLWSVAANWTGRAGLMSHPLVQALKLELRRR